jgi:hypothetical protein
MNVPSRAIRQNADGDAKRGEIAPLNDGRREKRVDLSPADIACLPLSLSLFSTPRTRTHTDSVRSRGEFFTQSVPRVYARPSTLFGEVASHNHDTYRCSTRADK